LAPVAVVTDTCHYLPRAIVEAQDLHLVSLYVHWNGREDRESDLHDYDAYYDQLRKAGELPTTSQPSIGDFLSVWDPLLDAGREIVSIQLAAGLSGTFESAEQARNQLPAERAQRVHVLDSATACGGQGMMLLAACAAARAGGDGAAVAERARTTRERLKMWFCIDTLEYLRRGGRIGSAQAWLGSALKIKPILTVESEITPVERVRTQGRAFERMVDYLRSRQEDGADGWVVQHIQAHEQAERLVERGREVFGSEPLFVSEVGPVIGTHVGPGLIGVGGVPSACLR
jgi:DegV family protein with EDD domain